MLTHLSKTGCIIALFRFMALLTNIVNINFKQIHKCYLFTFIGFGLSLIYVFHIKKVVSSTVLGLTLVYA